MIALVLLFALSGFAGFAFAAPPTQNTQTSTPTRTVSITATRSITPTLTLTTMATVTTTRRITATTTFTPSLTITSTETITATPSLTATVAFSPTLTPTPTSTATSTPTITPTPTQTPIRYSLALDPKQLSIDALRARPYGGSGVKIVRTVATNEAYKQVLIEYVSDGLRITGEMNIPRGIGPFPVVILDHGYFKPAEYKTGDGTNRAADAFARRGYLTIAPDYRCYAGSQCGSNPFYIGYAIDVLNLIAQVSSIPDADVNRLGIWGHSMGGGITLRVLTINDSIKVASLYGALTGDDEVHYCWLIGCKVPLVATPIPARPNQRLLEVDPEFAPASNAPVAVNETYVKLHEIFQKSSASNNLSNITAATIVHHGEADDIVPIEWSVDLVNALNSLGKRAVLYTYPGEGHVFAGWGWQLFMTRTINFFDDYLKPRAPMVTVDERVLRQERIAAELGY
jgi:dienelactone hydrolase